MRELGRNLPAEQTTVVLVDEMPSPESAHTLFGRLRDELRELPIAWLVAADARDSGLYREPPADAFWHSMPQLESPAALRQLAAVRIQLVAAAENEC